MNLLFVFDMFWNPRFLDDPSDHGNFMMWFEEMGITDDYTKDFNLSEDLDEVTEFLGRREKDRNMFHEYRKKREKEEDTEITDNDSIPEI